MLSSVVNLAAADFQNVIGTSGLEAGSLGHMATHGILGCATSALQGGSCAAGAAGAVAYSALSAGMLRDRPDPADYEGNYAAFEADMNAWDTANEKLMAIVGGGAGYLFSGGEAQNVNIASSIAVSGYQNNLCGTGLCVAGVIWAVGAAWTAYDIYHAEKSIEALITQGAITLVAGLGGKVAYKIGGKVYDNLPGLWKYIKNTGLDQTVATNSSVVDKLDRYLLNTDHPIGKSKAKWFEQALGFNKSNLDDLAKQIKFDTKKAIKTVDTEYGTKYNQVISIKGANGKTIDVTFGWIKNNDGVVRLTTAIPTKK